MSVANLIGSLNEKRRMQAEANKPTEEGQNRMVARIVGFDGPFIEAQPRNGGGEILKFRLADAEEFARHYIVDDKLSDDEKLSAAQKRIARRPSVQDFNNRKKLTFSPVGSTIEIEKPRRVPNGKSDEFMSAWIKGLSNEPEREAVLEGKINLVVRKVATENNRSSAPVGGDVDRDRSYSVSVVLDKLSVNIQSPRASETARSSNLNHLNKMVSGKIINDDPSDPGFNQPNDALTTKGNMALIGVQMDDGSVISSSLGGAVRDPSNADNFIAHPDGIVGYLDNLKNKPLSVATDRDQAKTVVAAAVAAAVGYTKALPVADQSTRALVEAVKQGVENDSIKVVAAPQVWVPALKNLRLQMTDLPIEADGAGRLQPYANKGYFDGKICLRTHTNDGRAFEVSLAKSVSLDVQYPRADYKPLYQNALVENIVAATVVLETVRPNQELDGDPSQEAPDYGSLPEEEADYDYGSPGM